MYFVALRKHAFVERLLGKASARDRPILVVLILRTEFGGKIRRQHPRLTHLFVEQAQLSTAIGPAELRRSIACPAERLGCHIEEATKIRSKLLFFHGLIVAL